jgi:hypothetical protein
MDWIGTLRRSGGFSALARQIGSTPANVALGAQALMPALIAGLREFRDGSGGGEAGIRKLLDLLDSLGDGDLAVAVMGQAQLDVGAGNALLETILGVRRQRILGEAERWSELDPELLERLLPALAMLVGGYVSAKAHGSGAAGSGGLAVLGGLLDGRAEDEVGDPPEARGSGTRE